MMAAPLLKITQLKLSFCKTALFERHSARACATFARGCPRNLRASVATTIYASARLRGLLYRLVIEVSKRADKASRLGAAGSDERTKSGLGFLPAHPRTRAVRPANTREHAGCSA
jgi:hypothetical protein